jgi:C_GCAxxG_C_C family probable redox protein
MGSSQYADKAVAAFMLGQNCAQATVSAFTEALGAEPHLLARMSAGFGGGMAGRRETCGAVSAMALVAGACAGDYAPKDAQAKTRFYALVRSMIDAFIAEHGTISCGELLSNAGCEARADPQARSDDYYARRPCARFVATAAGIIAKTFPDKLP